MFELFIYCNVSLFFLGLVLGAYCFIKMTCNYRLYRRLLTLFLFMAEALRLIGLMGWVGWLGATFQKTSVSAMGFFGEWLFMVSDLVLCAACLTIYIFWIITGKIGFEVDDFLPVSDDSPKVVNLEDDLDESAGF